MQVDTSPTIKALLADDLIARNLYPHDIIRNPHPETCHVEHYALAYRPKWLSLFSPRDFNFNRTTNANA